MAFFFVLLVLFYSFFLSVSLRFQRLPCDYVSHEAPWSFFSLLLLLLYLFQRLSCMASSVLFHTLL